MIVEKITFQQTFPTGEYQNMKLGIEIALTDTDTPLDAYVVAKGLVNTAFQKLHPQPTFTNETLTPIGQSIQSIDYKARENAEKEIDNASTIQDLEFYYEAAEKYGLMDLYNERLKMLQ